MQSTLTRFARSIKLRAEADPDRPCMTPSCRHVAPAPGPRKCRYCRALETVERVLRRVSESDNGGLLDVIAETVQLIEADSRLWTDPRYRALIGMGVDRAASLYLRDGSPAEAVRRVRDPILDPDPEDDFWGIERLRDEEARTSTARFFDESLNGRGEDPNGPSDADVARVEYNGYMASEL